jgi:hypothetical protein
MRKLTLLGLVILLLPLLAGCGTTVDSTKADFCDDLGAFSESLAGLRDISISSTKDDLQAALKDAEDAWVDVKDSAGKLEDVQLDAVENAFDDLKDAIQDIPDDASLAEALAGVNGAAVIMLSEVVKITTTTCRDSE